MADAEVKIKIRADAEIDALEKARDELKKLRAEQRDLESQGGKIAAGQVRRRADKLESQIDREAARMLRVEDDEARRAAQADRAAQRDQAREARTRAGEERRVTRELAEQTAMRKAGVHSLRDRVAGAVNAGQQIASSGNAGGTGAGMLLNAGFASGNPMLLAGALVAAAGVGFAGLRGSEGHKDVTQGMGVQQRDYMRAYRMNRQGGIFGSSSGLTSDALSMDEEIEDRKSRRADIEERAKEKWWAPSTWKWFGMRKNDAEREGEVNEAEIEKLEARKSKAIEAAREKYMREEGGLELRALRGRAQRSLAGSRDAMRAELGAEWMSKYKQATQAGADDSTAIEMANLTVQNQLRDRQAAAGAGLVDAKSGAGGIAAAAGWAQQAFPDMTAEIRNLHATVQAQANPLKDQAK